MNPAPCMMAIMEPPDSEVMVKRLLKVAEILSRTPNPGDDEHFSGENDPQKHGDQKIGYRETNDRFIDT